MKHLISVPPNVIPHFHHIAGVSKEDWFVSADPKEKKAGSGGGTSWLLSEMWNQNPDRPFSEWLKQEKRIIIHAGGQGRRLPAYAPLGKSLMPVPVFRWSRGQNLNQRLINLQVPLFERILQKAPPHLNTLIASGDTLIFGGDGLPPIPDADIVCFGLWLEPEKATRHGVFFARRETPGQLEFMLQKPSIETIRQHISDSLFLMDIGIWLLSPRATELLMRNSGWQGAAYREQLPDEYDMYSSFGAAMGANPSQKDPEINALKVALVNPAGGEFYHFGNTSELTTSTMAVQNRINDQRVLWHHEIKPHPSIFVLNTDTHIEWQKDHRNIWIENACVPSSWTLSQNHALTGIPENRWNLHLEKGNCLDMVPALEGGWIIRNYGFYDDFRGRLDDSQTRFMDEPLEQWLAQRELSGAFEHLPGNTDIHSLPLFPVLSGEELNGDFIQWLLRENPSHQPAFTRLWLNNPRLSAAAIGEKCDIPAAEKQRQGYLVKDLPLLAANQQRSVFYQLDLQQLAGDYVKHQLPLPPPLPENTRGWLPIHDHMFRARMLRDKGLDGSNHEQKAFAALREQVLDVFLRQPVTPRISLLTDQIAWGRSPVRLDLAGGWSDTPPYGMLYGGKVVNLAAELNGQPPLHCYIRSTETPQIVLRSIDLGERETIQSFDELKSFYNIRSAFSIPKAALALAGFLPEFAGEKYPSLREQLTALGGGLEITILAAVPKGSGLGTSSILAATVLGTLSEVCGLNWDKMEIGQRTLALEQLLTTGGGWQDQYGGLLEGIKLLETTPGNQQVPSVKWLSDSLFFDPLSQSRMLLYYTGITRVAKNILADIVRGMFLNSAHHLALIETLKEHAADTYEALLRKDFSALGACIGKSWQLNQKLDAGTNTPEIAQILSQVKPWLDGQKLLGAGGGGFMLMIAKDAESAARIRQELTNNPTNPRARFVDFALSTTGFQVTRS